MPWFRTWWRVSILAISSVEHEAERKDGSDAPSQSEPSTHVWGYGTMF
jgi:hypothetical protein